MERLIKGDCLAEMDKLISDGIMVAAIPEKGKASEKGCVGFPWYDIEKWRTMLNNKLNE